MEEQVKNSWKYMSKRLVKISQTKMEVGILLFFCKNIEVFVEKKEIM